MAVLKVARVTAGGETRGRVEEEREGERAEEEVGQLGFMRENLTFTQLPTSPVLFFFFFVVCRHNFSPLSDAGSGLKKECRPQKHSTVGH